MGDKVWKELAAGQTGVISRPQLLGLGLTRQQARSQLDNGRWQTVLPGVYLTHSGPISSLAQIWAAVLYAGAGAMAGGRTALWLCGALSECPDQLEICIPWPRRVRAPPGVTIHRVRNLAPRRAPAKSPPCLRIEHAVMDVAERQPTPEAACGVVLSVLQQRLTTAGRVRDFLSQRCRYRWRALIMDVLNEFDAGVHSPLELRFRRDVERAHRLPEGVRNRPTVEADGRHRYRDIRYESYRLVVELDGREAHPVHEAFRDQRRDNAAVLGGEAVLRYGWRDVAHRPCSVAAQVSTVLAAHGWVGRPRPCGPRCIASQAVGQ